MLGLFNTELLAQSMVATILLHDYARQTYWVYKLI